MVRTAEAFERERRADASAPAARKWKVESDEVRDWPESTCRAVDCAKLDAARIALPFFD